jgi:ATP-dependent DNA helicase HFM1/MER3
MDFIDDECVRVADVVPPNFAPLFAYDRFNAMQSALIPQLLETDENMVVAAPTGSGKTVVHELAILRLLQLRGESRDLKCVFIAPNKALCQQRTIEWNESFGNRLGLRYELRLEVYNARPS